jgi:hypothetical protein
MTKKFSTLDQYREAAEKKFGSHPVQIDENTTVVLRNPIRMSDKERQALTEVKLKEEDAKAAGDERSYFERAADVIRIVAETTQQAEKLLEAINGDLGILLSIIEDYMVDEEKAGKASESQD